MRRKKNNYLCVVGAEEEEEEGDVGDMVRDVFPSINDDISPGSQRCQEDGNFFHKKKNEERVNILQHISSGQVHR